MKRLLVFFGLTIFTLCSFSQDCKSFSFTAAFESGYSINHSMVSGFNVGANFKHFGIRVGMDAHLTDRVRDGLVLRTGLTHTFDIGQRFYGTAGLGYAYLYKSADKASLNSNEFLINPEFGWKWEFKEQPMALYLSGVKAGDIKIILIGIRSYF